MHQWGIWVLLLVTIEVSAADFYVDPIHGSDQGDGSFNAPWQRLDQVIAAGLIETRDWASHPPQADTELVTVNPGAPIKAGDRIWLRNGYHGAIDLNGAYNAAMITVASQPGHQAQVASIKLVAVQNWRFDGLSISTSYDPNGDSENTLFQIRDFNFQGPSYDVVLENSELFTVDDASAWNASQWINDTASGVSVRSERITISHNTIRNVRFGITVNAADALISHNLIDGFSADGIRGLGDGAIYEYNRIQNCYVSSSQGDSNHDDGFQSWSFGAGGVGTGVVKDVVLRGNTFINYTDPNNPLNATMQGIGCFDGDFENWVVENNVVATDHWHGISFYGMHNSRIINNTVLDLNTSRPGPPWIKVTASDQGPSQDVVVRNNLATSFALEGNNIADDHNMLISDQAATFVNAPYNLQLLLNGPAIDAGSALMAPLLDIQQQPRPHGVAHDLGAYEFQGDLIFANGLD